MDFTVYAISLNHLETFASEHAVPPHHFGITIERSVFGESLYGHNLSERLVDPAPPTLQSLLERRSLQLHMVDPDDIFAVFGRLSDEGVERTVATLETRKELVLSGAILAVQNNISFRR